MERAIELALRGKGKTSPNPMVGAVIYNDRKIVGEGYHRKAGTDHAEIVALKKAGKLAKDAALYVTLEPCCHTGRTPPCTKAIIKSGIKKVVIGMQDPNPIVAGKGINELRQAGILVLTGLLQKDVERINEKYIKFISTGYPFVLMKIGMSLDGKIATPARESKWITSEESRKIVHSIRGEVDAIMIGAGTLIQDNPNLLVSPRKKKNAARIIVDSSLRTPIDYNILDNLPIARTIFLTTELADKEKIKLFRDKGAEVILTPLDDGRVDIKEGMRILGEMGIISIMLEGGSELNYSCLSKGLVDKVLFFIAPKIIGGKEGISSVGGKGIESLKDAFHLTDITLREEGKDIIVEGYIRQKKGRKIT